MFKIGKFVFFLKKKRQGKFVLFDWYLLNIYSARHCD